MRTILFAHDQQESPEERRHYLEQAGYDVRLHSNFASLQAALDEPGMVPSLVLIDALLEGRHGFDAVRTIAKRTPDRGFPIVMCARIYREPAFRDEALKCGAQDYLLLPIPPEEFLRRVNQAIAYHVPPEASPAA